MTLFLKLLRVHLRLISQPKFQKTKFLCRNFNNLNYENITEVSSTVIKRILKSYNINYEDGFTSFIINCPACGVNLKPNSLNVYINKTTGMFMCSHCHRNGLWNQFESFLMNPKNKKKKSEIESENKINEKQKLEEFLHNIKNSTKEFKSEINSDELCEKILKKFHLPVIPLTSCRTLDIRIDRLQENLYFPLENAESKLVGYRKLNCHDLTEETFPNVTFGGLLTKKHLKIKDTAVLVPYLSDFLVLLNAKISGNIVCLPNGLNSLSQYVLPSLERFQKLILWFGNDVKGWDSARQFAKKLDEKRCLFIRPTENNLLPHQLEAKDIKSVIGSAQTIWHKSITTFSALRSDILYDLQNIDKIEGIKWIRYPTLNKILKGHRRGELTVITGPTGSGKTTFISDYSLDLAMQGVNTLWGSFEIRNPRLARIMLQQFSGIELDKHLNLFDEWADKFEKLPIYFMSFHGQQSIKVVMEAVEHATYVHDITHIIIDNLQFMMGMTEIDKHFDRFWKQDEIVAAFRTFATRKNCHVTLVIHPRKERIDEDLTTSSIFGGAKASQEADNVLIIQDKRLTSIRGKKYLQVAKNRYSGDLGVMALDFDKTNLSYAQKKMKKTEETDNIHKEV